MDWKQNLCRCCFLGPLSFHSSLWLRHTRGRLTCQLLTLPKLELRGLATPCGVKCTWEIGLKSSFGHQTSPFTEDFKAIILCWWPNNRLFWCWTVFLHPATPLRWISWCYLGWSPKFQPFIQLKTPAQTFSFQLVILERYKYQAPLLDTENRLKYSLIISWEEWSFGTGIARLLQPFHHSPRSPQPPTKKSRFKPTSLCWGAVVAPHCCCFSIIVTKAFIAIIPTARIVLDTPYRDRELQTGRWWMNRLGYSKLEK